MELRLPELSSSTAEAIITAWHVAENGHVVKDQDIVEVATDKATFDIQAPCDGILTKVIKKKGEKTRTGEAIAQINEDGR